MHKEIESKIEGVNDYLQEVMEDLDNANIKLTESPVHVYLFEIDKKVGDYAFRKSSKQYDTISVKMKLSYFTSPTLKAICREIDGFRQQYKKEQSKVVETIYKVVSGYYPVLEAASGKIAEIDVLCAFAQVAQNSSQSYVRPVLVASDQPRKLHFTNCRHPCLENSDFNDCIANDCSMSSPESIFHIITGPNMAGKSTYIRQVAICALLSHIGCFVPAEEAELSLIDSIITRVGASDLQIKGISTFMAEMLETSCMLNTATNKSLLIIDEIGRGTSTSEGYGIARGVAEYIVGDIKAFCLFATHFYEITNMEQIVQGVQNYNVRTELSEGKLIMTYQLKKGAVNKSLGIFVMGSTGFPQALIKDAEERLDELLKSNEGASGMKSGYNSNANTTGFNQIPEKKSNKMEIEDQNLTLKEEMLNKGHTISLAKKMHIIKIVNSYKQRMENAESEAQRNVLNDEVKQIVQKEINYANSMR